MVISKIAYKILSIALLISSAHAANDEVNPGYYEIPQGGGHLSIERIDGGKFLFEIESHGVNGHSCNLEGDIVKTVATLETSGSACVINFEQVNQGEISVSTATSSCRNFCGQRADFDGTYYLLSANCGPLEAKNRRGTFLQQYQARIYPSALATLNSFYRECSTFLSLFEIDEVRNDLAITQFKLKQYDDCLATLKQTLAISSKNEEGLRYLAPADFERYKPIADAAWHNQKLCEQGQKTHAKP